MKILVLTLCTENLEYGPYTNENALSYCKKNDYDIVIHKEIIDDSRPPAWSKVLLAQQYMNKGYDYLIIKDADTLFYNFNKKLEDYVSGEDFVFCSNTYGIIDTSFFYIKCHKKNELILKRVYNEFTNHIFKRAWEQAPFHILWRENELGAVKVHKKNILNAWCDHEGRQYKSDIDKETFIVHFFGWFKDTEKNKANLEGNWLSKIINMHNSIKKQNLRNL